MNPLQDIFEKRPPPSFHTIRDLIDHYSRIGDAGLNHSDPEHYRLKTLSRRLGNIAASDLRGSDLARFRDDRSLPKKQTNRSSTKAAVDNNRQYIGYDSKAY